MSHDLQRCAERPGEYLLPFAHVHGKRSNVFSHIFVGVDDFERPLAFYRALMPVIGARERFCDRGRPWAGWQSEPGPRPLLVIGRPCDQRAHEVGNGQMIVFLAATRDVVDRAHAVALAHGGTDEGAPGLRPEYHAHYYGGYFRDSEGHKLCVACHASYDHGHERRS